MLKPSVLHVVNNLNVSGATTLLLDVAANVTGEGGLAVCTLEPENPMSGRLLEAGARVISPNRKLGLASGTRWVCRAIRQTRPDIVHTHLLPATQVGLAAARLTGKPVVTTVHFTFERLGRSKLLRRMNQVSFAFYKRIFAISDAVKQSILDHCNVSEESVVVLRSGVDFTRIRPADPDLRARTRQQLGIAEEELVVGSVGRLEKIKGYDLLIDAVAQVRADFPSTRLVLVGDGPERTRLQQQAAEQCTHDGVVFAGTQKEPGGFLASFDVFVLPSLFEGLGLSIVEAMIAGLPVVGSTAGGIPEVVSHGGSGLLFEAGNCSDLARCLHQLIRAPELRRRLAAAGKAKVEKEFAIERYVERLYGEYAEMLPAAQNAQPAETSV